MDGCSNTVFAQHNTQRDPEGLPDLKADGARGVTDGAARVPLVEFGSVQDLASSEWTNRMERTCSA